MNYAKWDKFAAEQSDSDSEDRPFPVHTLGDSQSVSIGPSGYNIASNCSSDHTSSCKVQQQTVKESIVSSLSEYERVLQENGSHGDNYFWRQDRQEVVVTVVVPVETKGKHVTVLFDSSNKTLSIVKIDGAVLLSKVLRHGINTETMTAPDPSKKHILHMDGADWEIRTLPGISKISTRSPSEETTRVIEIVLHKVSPLPGAVFWWSACFVGEADIDVTKIAGRSNMIKNNSNASSSDSTNNKTHEQKLLDDPFVQAQKMFAEKMRNKEKISVDLNNDS